ncbi:Tyrosine ammonia-lyase [compost metagenome]
MDSKFNGGLPSNLSGASGERCMINHGFKAVQIGVSAWTAEALKLTMPASVFSRSTECHNQDKVSMGTIAARDALRVLTLSEQVGAACLLAAVQGVELSLGARQCDLETLSQPLRETILAVRADHPPLVEDRPLEQELRALIARLQARHYDLYKETSDAA